LDRFFGNRIEIPLARLQGENCDHKQKPGEWQFFNGNVDVPIRFPFSVEILKVIQAQKMRSESGPASPMPIREAATLTATLARVVEFAHRHGILHRDLKPSNILLTPEGQPKIVDFGLAKQLGNLEVDPLTHSGQMVGTPAYMAPEQADASHDKVGPASDIYALGTIFYEMLIGKRPFTGGTTGELLLRIQSEAPAPPRRSRPEIPRELDAICLKCLEKDPEHRYTSAAALADDLERWFRGEPICLPSSSVFSRPRASQGFWHRLVRFFSFRRSRTGSQEGHPPDA
jgi:serine/threonine protein kinase